MNSLLCTSLRYPETPRWSRSATHPPRPLLAETAIRQILVGHGAKIDVVNEEGWTPLHLAAISRDVKVVEVSYPFTLSTYRQKGHSPDPDQAWREGRFRRQ